MAVFQRFFPNPNSANNGTINLTVTSASYALTASYAMNGGGGGGGTTTGSFTGSFTGSLNGTASYALTASYLLGSITSASYASNASNASAIDVYSFGSPVDSYILMSNVIATSGVAVGGDSDLRYNSSTNKLTVGTVSATSLTGSLLGTASYSTLAQTASYVQNAQTASYVQQAVSSSYASTASYVVSALTASYVTLAQTASYVTTAQTASYITTAQTASYVATASYVTGSVHNSTNPALSASYALTASYALNAGGSTVGTGSNSTGSFTNQSTWTFDHNLNNRFVLIQAYDASWNQIIPQNIQLVSTNQASLTFPSSISGYAIASLGGIATTSSVTATNAITASLAFTASYITSSNIVGTVTSASYASTSSYINTLNQNVTLIPINNPGTSIGLTISGSGGKGGAGYLDFLQVTNTSASISNPNKYFRLNASGDIEILRSDYNAGILSLSNGGILSVGGDNAASASNNDAVTNYLSFGSNNTQIYDDGNTHIHSRGNGASMWINTNGGQLNLLTQNVVSGGAPSGSGIAIGTGTLTGYVTINSSKAYTTAASYGYLTTGGAGTYPGGSQTVNISLYATQRIWGQEIDAFSDERMKNIEGEISLEDGIKLVKTLKPIKYTWKDNTDIGLKAGYSAQQVSKAGFDHLISLIPKEGLEETIDDDGFVSPKDTQFSMNYDQVTPYHGVVIKYLLEKIEQLEAEIKILKQ